MPPPDPKPIISTSEATPGTAHRIGNWNPVGGLTDMKFFDSWWQRVPGRVQAGLLGLSLVAMVLGGMAQEYWH
jgi:hypothetical protein